MRMRLAGYEVVVVLWFEMEVALECRVEEVSHMLTW